MAYSVTLERLGTSALMDLKGPQEMVWGWCGDTLPRAPSSPNTRSGEGSREVLWLGPDHWILRDSLANEDGLLGALRPLDAPDDISIVRISDTLCFFRIAGDDAEDILAVASPLDIAGARRQDYATFTSAFGLKALIATQPDGFEIGVDHSLADFLEDRLQALANSAFSGTPKGGSA